MVTIHLRGLLIAVAFSAPAWAQTDAAVEACHNRGSTMQIVECLDRLNGQADAHLNAAYQKTIKSLEPSGVTALRAAQRAWLEYRKQRCAYRTDGLGTLGQVVGVDCMVNMTRARADELEADSKGMAGP